MPKYNGRTGELKYCPFCGKPVNWTINREIRIATQLEFQCYHCDGIISIYTNEIKDRFLFDIDNEFLVESTGAYNYGLLTTGQYYYVNQLVEKANFAHLNSEGAFSKENNEASTYTKEDINKKIDEQMEKIKSPAPVKKTINKFKLIKNIAIVVGAVIVGFIIYYNFIK